MGDARANSAGRPRVGIVIARSGVLSEKFIQDQITGLKDVAAVYHTSRRLEGAWVGAGWLLLSKALQRARAAEADGRRGALERMVERGCARSFGARLKRDRIDVVLAQYGYIGARVYRGCRLRGIPLVVHFHGHDAHSASVVTQFRNDYRIMLREARAVISVSGSMTSALVELGAPRDRIREIPYGVRCFDERMARPENADKHIVAVGRLVEKKAPQNLLVAFKLLLARHPEARLTLVGDGPLRESCALMIHSLRLRDRVVMAGALPNDAVREIQASARCFGQHSIVARDGDSEGAPNSILEACSLGVPVVATHHAGIPEIVEHGVGGFLVAEGDVAGMCDAWDRFMSDPALAGEFGKRARMRVNERFDCVKQWSKLDSVLIEARAPDPAREEMGV